MFELSIVGEWNLSYECLTSQQVREAVQNLKQLKLETDCLFYQELIQGKTEKLPTTKKKVAEDEDIVEDEAAFMCLEDMDADDCDLSIRTLVQVMMRKEVF